MYESSEVPRQMLRIQTFIWDVCGASSLPVSVPARAEVVCSGFLSLSSAQSFLLQLGPIAARGRGPQRQKRRGNGFKKLNKVKATRARRPT